MGMGSVLLRFELHLFQSGRFGFAFCPFFGIPPAFGFLPADDLFAGAALRFFLLLTCGEFLQALCFGFALLPFGLFLSHAGGGLLAAELFGGFGLALGVLFRPLVCAATRRRW